MITAYTFTFTSQHSWSCVGFVYDTNGISAWPVDQDVRSQSMVICSDNTFYNVHQVIPTVITAGSTFTISIDLVSNTFVIQEVNGYGKFTGCFDSASYLFYSIQTMDQTIITFDETIQKALPATDNFNWAYLTSHKNVEVVSATAQIQAVSDKYMNLFGEDFNLNANCGFEFTFQQSDLWACVGFVEVATGSIDNLPLNQDIRDYSHLVCSDGSQYQVTSGASPAVVSSDPWTVTVDNTAHQITFSQTNGASFVTSFDSTKELHFTTQFALDGIVQFTPSIVNSAGCPELGSDYSGEIVVSQESQVAVYNDTYYDLSWISGLSSNQVSINSGTGQIQSTGDGIQNIFGSTFTEVQVTSFTFTFAYSMTYTCMGFVEQEGLSLLNVNQDMSAQSLSICSDGTVNGLSNIAAAETAAGASGSAEVAVGVSFSVSVNVDEQSVVFRQVDGNNIYVGYYENEENLYYSASFNSYGSIQFGSNVGYVGDDPLAVSQPDTTDGVETLYGLDPQGYNFDFSWINQNAPDSLVFDSVYAKIVNQDEASSSAIGESFSDALISGFDFTLLGGGNGAQVCVGFVDAGLPVQQQAISLCSDGTFNGVTVVTSAQIQVGSEFLVNIDPTANQITFSEIGGNGQFSASYSSNDNLKYFTSFGGSGAVSFGPSLRFCSTTAQA